MTDYTALNPNGSTKEGKRKPLVSLQPLKRHLKLQVLKKSFLITGIFLCILGGNVPEKAP